MRISVPAKLLPANADSVDRIDDPVTIRIRVQAHSDLNLVHRVAQSVTAVNRIDQEDDRNM